MSDLSAADWAVGLGLLVLMIWLLSRRLRLASSPVRSAGLVGPIERFELERQPGFGPADAPTYTACVSQIEAIAAAAPHLEIIAFVGTWCPDSVRQVPRFLQLLDQAGFQKTQCRLIGLDRTKRDRAGLAERYAIERVPTFVVMRRGREVGRITERPDVSLEHDLAAIVAGSLEPSA